MTPVEAATVYARLAYVVKILQEGREMMELPETRSAREACLLRALNELKKALGPLPHRHELPPYGTKGSATREIT